MQNSELTRHTIFMTRSFAHMSCSSWL